MSQFDLGEDVANAAAEGGQSCFSDPINKKLINTPPPSHKCKVCFDNYGCSFFNRSWCICEGYAGTAEKEGW